MSIQLDKWSFTDPAMLANAVGSFTARSAKIFRFIVMPASLNPRIKTLYERPCILTAALIRQIHKRRKSLFLTRLSRYEYASARCTLFSAIRYSLLLAPRYPLAIFRIFRFRRFDATLILTLGMLYSLLILCLRYHFLHSLCVCRIDKIRMSESPFSLSALL